MSWSTDEQFSAEQFLEDAALRSMDSFLGNPLLLELLYKSVGAQHWPSSRTETYHLACQKLLAEHNDDLKMARVRERPSEHRLLRLAQHAAALQVLSGSSAFVVDYGGEAEPNEIGIDKLGEHLAASPSEISDLMSRKLFVAEGARRQFRHRSIAEFLAGAHVAHRVEDGLPVSRALAVMTTSVDDRVVEPMRGIYAWLAARCPAERGTLISADPLALILYGDVKDYSPSEKEQVLNALLQEAERFSAFRMHNWEQHPFAALVTPDMTGVLLRWLNDARRDMAHEAVVDCICDGIAHAAPSKELIACLSWIFRDESRVAYVRRSAMHAIAVTDPKGESVASITNELRSGAIDDPDDELIGQLLTDLYPRHISVEKLLEHLKAPRNSSLIGRYYMFWAHDVARDSSHAQLIELAGSIPRTTVRGSDGDLMLRSFAGDVLVRCVLEMGEQASDDELRTWLELAAGALRGNGVDGEEQQKISDWLSEHPERLKAAYRNAMKSWEQGAEPRPPLWSVGQMLMRARKPDDWADFLLECAQHAAVEDVARRCFRDALWLEVMSSWSAEELEKYMRWASENEKKWPNVWLWVKSATQCDLNEDSFERRNYFEKRKRQAESVERSAKKAEIYRPHTSALIEGKAQPCMAREMAVHFFTARQRSDADTLIDRVASDTGLDSATILAIAKGLAKTSKRDDVPPPAEIFEHARRNPEKRLCLQDLCLITAAGNAGEEQDDARGWTDAYASSMVAFALQSHDTNKVWLKQLAAERPQTVANVVEIYLQLNQASLRLVSGMLSRPEYLAVARLTALKLIDVLDRCNNANRLDVLEDAVQIGMRALDPQLLLQLCRDKQRAKSTAREERLLWLCCAFLLDPSGGERAKLATVREKKSILTIGRNLGLLLTNDLSKLDTYAIHFIVLLIAPHCKSTELSRLPARSKDDDEQHAARLVRSALKELSSRSDAATARLLSDLRLEKSIQSWKFEIDSASYECTRALRLNAYKMVGVDDSAAMLRNAQPANAKDLAALIVDHARLTAMHIRFDETNQIRQFWWKDRPKIENDCRDAFMAPLRLRLQRVGVQIEKEPNAAGDKRGDLQGVAMIGGERVVVPVEIKKDDHADVWIAWRTQLLERYMSNPAAQGMGIYLIFWFNYKTRRPPNGGRKPATAAEMASRMSQEISTDLYGRLHGLVVDLTM